MQKVANIFALTSLWFLSIRDVMAHLAILQLQGETNGQVGKAYGEVDGTPRNGTARFPFQADSGIVRQADIENGLASVCGRTLLGPIDMNQSLQKAEREGLPDVSPGGLVTLLAHQINADGGGPYSCTVDLGATGNNFQPIEIKTNIPGANGRSDARAIDLPLVAKMPDGAQCTGGSDGQTCLIRCLNGAKAGPFGGCMAFTQSRNGPIATQRNSVLREVDMFSDTVAQLMQKAQNEPVTIMPIANKIIPQNLSKGKKRQLGPLISSTIARRQQLMVQPPVSRIAPVTTTSTPASTSFGTNLGNSGKGSGVLDNNGGNGNAVVRNTANNATATNNGNNGNNGKAAKTAKNGTTRTKRQNGQSNNRQSNNGQSNDIQTSSYVPSKAPTTEGISYEIRTGPLAQADVPRNTQNYNNKRSILASRVNRFIRQRK